MKEEPDGSIRAAILFADFVDSVGLFKRLGDDAAHAVIAAALLDVEACVTEHAGTVVKTIGDCVMARLPTADLAAAASVAIHRKARENGAIHQARIRFRVGFFEGKVILKKGDVYGDAVNMAHRLCEVARADQIITGSETSGSLSGEFAVAAKVFDVATLKGVARPITIIKLDWEAGGTTEVFDGGISASATAQESQPRLSLTCGERTREYSAADLPIQIGREATCDMVVLSPRASRQHGKITEQRRKFVWTDDSSNGTYIWQGGADTAPLFCRRETFPLVGEGWISLGHAEINELSIRFRVESA
ncbi:MAG: adenylate/guanylate cyclase domain-containing protein [Panacagrimonas sp.]